MNGVVLMAILKAIKYAQRVDCIFNSQTILDLSTIFVKTMHNILFELLAWPFAFVGDMAQIFYELPSTAQGGVV